MELNYKCGCGRDHEVRLYDECRHCAKPIGIKDWCMVNLTNDDLQSILEQRGMNYPKTITIGAANGQKETKSTTASFVGMAKKHSKLVRESVVD